ncbi:MAG TPA: IS200/IS605 family transposase [Candidatus Marinimicrobia bacterium]|nr:IS200/IS605 family transposase [Candidatus Neomarinimicrobiota bacterium]
MSSHSYNKVWLHLIWGTKRHQKTISPKVQPKVSQKLFEIAQDKNIFLKSCHVHSNHVHTLIDLPTSYSIEQTAKYFKGISSNYLKKEDILNSRFSWCKGYGVFSVSESVVEKVIKYIKNQDEHHRTKTFREEVQEFLAAYNLEYTEDWFLE